MWLAFVALPSPALAAPPGPPPIINGSVERGYPSAVGLGVAGFTLCTGNLVTPRVVLTAAHCQADLPPEFLLGIGRALVGTDATDPDYQLSFESMAVHPGYRELAGLDLGENDVSVLVLEEDAPDDVPPIWFRTAPLTKAVAVGEIVTSVGFGLTETNASGVKRSAPLHVSSLDEIFLRSDSADNDDRANICSGDSGGPQFHVGEDGRVEQWAVHSWGDAGCAFESGSTRTDVVSDWLLRQIEDVHGTSDFCEITGRYDDGACDPGCDTLDPDCVLHPSDLVTYGEVRGCATVSGAPGAGALLGAAWMLRRRTRPTSPDGAREGSGRAAGPGRKL